MGPDVRVSKLSAVSGGSLSLAMLHDVADDNASVCRLAVVAEAQMSSSW